METNKVPEKIPKDNMDTKLKAKDIHQRIVNGENAYDVLYDKMYSLDTTLDERIAQDAWCDKQIDSLEKNKDKILQSFIDCANIALKNNKVINNSRVEEIGHLLDNIKMGGTKL